MVSNHQNVAYENSYTAADQQPYSVRQRVFVAKMNSGELIMGTVYSSYVEIANALIAAGAVDAMAMDGGSSSMLYSNGKYLKSAGRELTMGLAVVDSPDVSRIPNTIQIPATDSNSAIEVLDSKSDFTASNDEDDTSDMNAFFDMVEKVFGQGNASDVNGNYVSMSPNKRPNTSVSFADEDKTQGSDSENHISILPSTSADEGATQPYMQSEFNSSADLGTGVSSPADTQTSYLTQEEFMTLLVEVTEKKRSGAMVSLAEKQGISVGSTEEAISKLNIFTVQAPDSPVTRAQAALSLSLAHRQITNENSSSFYVFSDCSWMDDETHFAVNYAVSNGFLNVSGSMFNPNNALSKTDGTIIRDNF